MKNVNYYDKTIHTKETIDYSFLLKDSEFTIDDLYNFNRRVNYFSLFQL